jgi:hypothetical protein
MPRLLLRTLLVVVSTATCLLSFSQNNFFEDKSEATLAKNPNFKQVIKPKEFRALSLNTVALLGALQIAPLEFTNEARSNPLVITLPMPDGSSQRFAIVNSPIQEPELAAKFPNIKTFSGQGIDDPFATLRGDWTEFGFHAQVFTGSGERIYIDPYARGEKTQYMSYNKKSLAPKPENFEIGVLDGPIPEVELAAKTNAGVCLGTQLRSYRLAIACTGEYAVAVGATTAGQLHSAIVTTINRVNQVYQIDLSVKLNLVATNNLVEFLDGTTDPFTGNSNANTLINESQTVIDANILSANYDVGHTFSTGAGGLAQRPAVCLNGSKARGVTGSPTPTGDAYDIDYVCHELGHQFSGSHTFNAITGNCSGNRSAAAAVEPGSGITIMGYAGICLAANDLAAHSIPYFHAYSQNEIGTYITVGSGNGCATATNTGNIVPVVNAGSSYTIPASTPFVLTGSATDGNGDALTYSWEEIDPGASGANWNSGSKPFFRSFTPTATPVRYFPQLSDIINATTTIGEILPTTAQTLNFRLTARDNRAGGGGVCSGDITVTTSTASSAFTVTSQPTATSLTANGSNTMTVTWNAGTTASAPFNAANVSILFSADGGVTWPYTIVASTANDGTETITVPAYATASGRIMVKAVGNVFFAVNSGNITVTTASCAAEGAVVSPSSNVTSNAGNGALNLGLSPQYSAAFAPSGTLETTDPISNLAVFNSTTSSCQQFSNQFKYDAYPFVVTAAGSYTFTFTTSTFPTMMNLYVTSFDASNPCTNFSKSNGTYNGTNVSIGTSITQTLAANTVYYLVIGTFSNTQPTLPAPYVVSVTGAGTAYAGTGIYANPGAGFSYAYVVVNNTTGNIVSITATANLTNSATYSYGSYTVYGISYANSVNLAPYVGGGFNALTSQIAANPASFCANISKNAVVVTITSNALPVSLLNLTARKQDSKVVLDWGTSSEQNSNYFSVQRSKNSSSFTAEVGKLQAAGNSSATRLYSLTDNTPAIGWNYYRVQQFDLDGKYTYSNIAAVNFEKNGSLMVIYPNPVKEKLNVEFTSERAGRLELQVIDSKGSVMLKQSASITNGRNLETLDVSTLSKGMYIIRYQDTNGNVGYTKFVKQ